MSPREWLWSKIYAYADAVRGGDDDVVNSSAEEVDRAVDDMPAVRRRLPKMRRSHIYEFSIGGVRTENGYSGGVKLYVRLGLYPDGRVGEVFLDTSKEGSDLRHFMNGFAIVVSLLLQVGTPMSLVVHVLGKLSGGPQGDVDGPEELGITSARSMIDLVAQVLSKAEENR